MKNPLLEMVEKRKIGIHCGIPSFCCANKLVLEAILEQAKRFDDTVLIEATSNQVNQDYGYTGMTPQDFSNFVFEIADRINFSREKIILGGDHMGPLPWVHLPASEAMKKAEELVRACVRAGYKKIHLDTSMRLGDDSVDVPLGDTVIAARGAALYKACEDEFNNILSTNPSEMHPVFVVGSEVPIPGGVQEDDIINITTPERFEKTLIAYRETFNNLGMNDAWQYIIAMVVQPGVEFSNRDIRHYNRMEAYPLCNKLKQYPDIVFEGHSTDFQSPLKLKEMVEDGIAIIKVGPALTFSLRDALYALAHIEDEIIEDANKRSHFINILEEVMIGDPKNWVKYYKGTEKEKKLDRMYSYSDRSRYYFVHEKVEKAIEKLFDNLSETTIPMGMLYHYMPLQYVKVRDGKIGMNPRELAKDSVVSLVEDYNFAVKFNYVTSSIFIR